MIFVYPHALWGLLGIVPLALLLARAQRARRRTLAGFASARMLHLLGGDLQPRRSGWRGALFLAALVTLTVALARPQWGLHMEAVQRLGLDVVIAVDCSSSMNARDFKPSRLEVARRELSDLVKRLEGNRLGLVGFAGAAYVLCPLTLDTSAARLFLDQLDVNAMPVPGTSLGDAVKASLSAFPAGDRNAKVIVLISDGEDHHSDPIGAARMAAEQGVVIHAVAIGSAAGEPIPELDAAGRTVGYVRDGSGQTVLSRVDEKTLREMARVSGGVYTHAAPGADMLGPVVAAVEGAAKSRLQGGLQPRYRDRFQIFVALGLALLLVERLLASGGMARPLGKAAAVALTAAACLGWTAGPAVAEASAATRARYLAHLIEGQRAWARGDHAGAKRAWQVAARERPEDPRAHDRLGQALYRDGQYAEAATEFQKAAAAPDAATRSRAAYNMGNALFKANQLEASAEAYKKALRANEADADARYNLAVVLDRLKKPPPKPDDKKPDKKKGKPKPGKRGDGSGKKPSPKGSGQKPKPKPQSGQAARGRIGKAAERAPARRDGEQLLRFFQEKERAALARQRAARRPATVAPGGETW